MSLKVHFSHSQLDYLLENLEAITEEQGQLFLLGYTSEMKKNINENGVWPTTAGCWRVTHQFMHIKENDQKEASTRVLKS